MWPFLHSQWSIKGGLYCVHFSFLKTLIPYLRNNFYESNIKFFVNLCISDCNGSDSNLVLNLSIPKLTSGCAWVCWLFSCKTHSFKCDSATGWLRHARLDRSWSSLKWLLWVLAPERTQSSTMWSKTQYALQRQLITMTTSCKHSHIGHITDPTLCWWFKSTHKVLRSGNTYTDKTSTYASVILLSIVPMWCVFSHMSTSTHTPTLDQRVSNYSLQAMIAMRFATDWDWHDYHEKRYTDYGI